MANTQTQKLSTELFEEISGRKLPGLNQQFDERPGKLGIEPNGNGTSEVPVFGTTSPMPTIGEPQEHIGQEPELMSFNVLPMMSADRSSIKVSSRPPGVGGGGNRPSTEMSNNLSFPVILADGPDINNGLAIPGVFGAPVLTSPYSYDGSYYYFAQKTDGNVWRAESAEINTDVVVDRIDWGDSLASRQLQIGKPVRVELTLYETLPDESRMLGYNMFMLANPSSPDEIQGVRATALVPPSGIPEGVEIDTFWSSEATVYAGKATMFIQQYEGDAEDLVWGDSGWEVDPDLSEDEIDVKVISTITPSFGNELNVGGKVIYGLSEGGWKPTAAGNYRLSFAVPSASNTQLELAGGDGDVLNNPSTSDIYGDVAYLDIVVVPRSGGGGGGGKPTRALAADIFSLGASSGGVPNEGLYPNSDDPLQLQVREPSTHWQPTITQAAELF
jgi:hypothetical protein